jgi:hypothetical protein
MALLKKDRPYRLLLVTFDLTDTVPGDARYKQADAAIAFHGLVFRPVKQLRLLLTRATSRAVKASLEQRLGRSVTILVAPLKSIPAWRIYGVAKRREWRRFVQALAEHGIDVQYVTDDNEN